MKLNPNEWLIKSLRLGDKFVGWYVVNRTYWGKTTIIDDETYFSGWDAYYLHKDGSIEGYSDYFATKEEAETALKDYLNKEKQNANITND